MATAGTISSIISLSVVLEAFGATIPLKTGPLTIPGKFPDGESIETWLKDQLKSLSFETAPGFAVSVNADTLIDWIQEKEPTYKFPSELRKLFNEVITVTYLKVSGAPEFAVAFTVLFNSGTVTLEGLPYGIEQVGFAIDIQKASA